MTVKIWSLFALTEFVLCLTPGPAVLTVVSQSMRFGARASTMGALGILSGNSVYFALSAVGLSAALIASAGLFMAIKLMGAGYLVILGLKMLLAAGDSHAAKSPSAQVQRRSRLFAQGFVVQVSNPKSIIFFSALLPQFVVVDRPNVLRQFLILGLTSAVIEFTVLTMYGCVTERGSKLFSEGPLASLRDRVAGLFLLGVGIRLATMQGL